MIPQNLLAVFSSRLLDLQTQVNSSTEGASLASPPLEIAITSVPRLLFSLFLKNQEFIYLLFIGALIEGSRRYWLLSTIWFKSLFCLTAQFDSSDIAYHWMMVWLSRQPGVWINAHSVNISTSNWGREHHSEVTVPRFDDFYEDEDNMNETRKLSLLPAYESEVWLKYKGVWIAISRKREPADVFTSRPPETLILRLYSRQRSRFLRTLISDAKAVYGAEDQDRIKIYSVGQYKEWKRTTVKKKRSLRSIILDPGIKKRILDDINDFFSKQKWYAARGIPYRRGYLLYGVPGSGKTSLIHSIAGELGLDVYIISLSKKGLDDRDLEDLFSLIPKKSIVLIEDIDAAFRGTAKKRSGVGETVEDIVTDKAKGSIDSVEDQITGGVTLSGLLNTLDGIAAQEGSIYFATTNRYHMLDKALCRPGRMDIHLEFKNATRWQAKELFKAFFPPSDSAKNAEPSDVILPYLKAVKGDPDEYVEAYLEVDEAECLSEEFAAVVPEEMYAVANIQGHFLRLKDKPWDAVAKVGEWLAEEALLKKASAVPEQTAGKKKGTDAASKIEIKSESVDKPSV